MLLRDLVAAYLDWARGYYLSPITKKVTSSVENIEVATQSFLAVRLPDGRLVADVDAMSVNAKLVYHAQQALANTGTLARSSINERMRIVKRCLKWAASPERELIPEDVPLRVSLVPPLKYGRSPAKEPPGVVSVTLEQVQQTCLFATDKLRAMITIHWHTGMRPSELCSMRLSALDTVPPIWLYRPQEHKTAYRGKARVIPLGPKARDALCVWLNHVKGDIIFPGTKGRPMCRNSYRLGIRNINAEHGLPQWTPSQVRHAYATRVQRDAGIEAAQTMLDHTSARTTEIYVDADVAAKLALARRFG